MRVDIHSLLNESPRVNCPVCEDTCTRMAGFTCLDELTVNYECAQGHRWRLIFGSVPKTWREFIWCEVVEHETASCEWNTVAMRRFEELSTASVLTLQ